MLQKVFGRNAHFQTIHPAFFRKVERTHGEQRLIEAYDGVQLQVYHHEKRTDHLVILTHGMEGDVHAPYIHGMSTELEKHGMDTLCWNMRNCGPDPVLTHTIYHSGRYDDLKRLIEYADETLGYDQISLVGFSLGGAIIMNYLGRSKHVNPKINRVCAVSSPLELEDSVNKLHQLNNRHYELYLLGCAKKKIKALKQKLGDKIVDTPPLITLNSFRKFDDHFTAPMIGLKSAQEYYRKIMRIKNAIKDLGFKTESGSEAKVIRIEDLGEGRSKIIASSGGKGLDKFQARKSDLSASMGQYVEEINKAKNDPSLIEIYAADKELGTHYKFKQAKELLTKPYSFIVGNSYSGPIVQCIRDLPHMFFAGTTGGGKSTFFNNVILGLMNSSKRIQFRLIDMKNSIEVQSYKDFPNVEIAATETKALRMLEDLNKLMDERFEYLKSKGFKSIDPERDNMDIIIIAFDEVSEVFDTSTRNKERKELRAEIYEHAHRLSKLSRAAGFHMIFATQKVKKQLLPTEIQSNIGGRMSFKMSTTSDSVTAIGNKRAFELPDTRGRAIWHKGNEYRKVQAPYLSDKDIENEICELKEKFKDENKVIKEQIVTSLAEESEKYEVHFKDESGQDAQ